MNNVWFVILIAALSYLFGSISTTRIVAKIVAPDADLENVHFVDKKTQKKHRLRTISATTASMKLGPKVGGIITLLDTLKGAIPVLVTRLLFPDAYYHLAAGLFVVAGHNWSLFYNFTGGAGFSTTNGVFFAINWLGALISALTGMGLGFMAFKDMFLAFLLPPWLMTLWFWIFAYDWRYILFGVILNIIILVKLSPDIIAYFKHRETEGIDYSSIMDQTGVGRGMKRMMQFFGINPDK